MAQNSIDLAPWDQKIKILQHVKVKSIGGSILVISLCEENGQINQIYSRADPMLGKFKAY